MEVSSYSRCCAASPCLWGTQWSFGAVTGVTVNIYSGVSLTLWEKQRPCLAIRPALPNVEEVPACDPEAGLPGCAFEEHGAQGVRGLRGTRGRPRPRQEPGASLGKAKPGCTVQPRAEVGLCSGD